MSLKELIAADEALEIVLKDVEPIGVEELPLKQAANKTLAMDLISLRTQPPFDASAMDGYAVMQSDVSSLPATLNVIGESKAGSPFDTPVQQGEAVRIFTGAVVPEGSDTIIIQENTHAGDGTVEVLTGTPQGKFIRKAGLDFNEGETLLNAGDTLTPYRLALAASMNHAQVPVFKQAKVAMISTGDELVMPGEATQPGQIIASNTFGIAASIENCGAHVLDLGIAGDTRDALRAKIFEAITSDADIIVTTGGASVGDHDLVLPVAQEIGFEFEIAKIAMRPGKPFLFGRFEHKGRTIYLTGLAGNPVSSLVAFNVFVKPLIQKLSGQDATALQRVPAVLGCDLPENDERAEYMRATLSISGDGKRIATPFTKQDSSMLANLVRADCLVYRAIKAPAAKAGDACEVVLIS
jgi:molybdopterin molybdotransferase